MSHLFSKQTSFTLLLRPTIEFVLEGPCKVAYILDLYNTQATQR